MSKKARKQKKNNKRQSNANNNISRNKNNAKNSTNANASENKNAVDNELKATTNVESGSNATSNVDNKTEEAKAKASSNIDNSTNATDKTKKDSAKSTATKSEQKEKKKFTFFFSPEFRKETKGYYIPFIPVIFVLGYLPILMRTLEFDTYLEDYDWASAASTTQVDVFLKIKAIFFIIVVVCMLLIMLMWFWGKRKRVFKRLNSVPFYIIAAAVFFVLLSGLFADNKALLLLGGFENFESIFVTLGYFITMIYTFLLFSESNSIYRDFRLVYRASMPGFLFTAIVGLFQVFGLDLFKTAFGQFLFASGEYRTGGGEITVGTGEYTTLHNIDYVSTFFGMWCLVFLVMFSMSKTVPEKIVRAALFILAAFDMFGAGSDGGRLGFAAAIIILIILLNVKSTKRLIISIVAICVVVGVVLAIPKTRNYIVSGINATDTDKTEKYRMHHITPSKEGVAFDLDGKEYTVAYSLVKEDGKQVLKVDLKDGNGNPINGTYADRDGSNPRRYTYDKKDFAKGMEISETSYKDDESGNKTTHGIALKSGDLSLMLSNEVDKSGDYYFLNPYGKFVKEDGTEIADAGVFPNKLFSSRGEIWNKTLPILKNYLFIGCGSGLFITAYPQGDYIERMFGSTNYDVKPHNLYLQYWVEEGLPFMLLLIVFYVLYYIMIIKGFRREPEDDNKRSDRRIALAATLAVTVFLASGIAGDSMIVHSPVFWTFLGLGMAAGYIPPKNKSKEG